MTLYFVPTYDCNLSCKSCYSKKYLNIYPDYLSWAKFITVYNAFAKNVNHISFIGGEATKWKFINEAILFLQNKKVRTTLFTNGINVIDAKPNNIIINANNLFNNQVSSFIIENLKIYKNSKTNVVLRFNIDEEFNKNTDKAICFAREYADMVSLSALFPVSKKNSVVGCAIYDFAKKINKLNIKAKISRATPLCLFDNHQREYLELNCKLKGTCCLPTQSIVINPDGHSVQPCVELSIIKKIDDYTEFSAKEYFKDEISKLKQSIDDDCLDCDFAFKGLCCGGCLAYKQIYINQYMKG